MQAKDMVLDHMDHLLCKVKSSSFQEHIETQLKLTKVLYKRTLKCKVRVKKCNKYKAMTTVNKKRQNVKL